MQDADLRTKFIDGMSRVAASVNVVTTDGPAGRFGLTVSAMCSVSADTEKPTLLVCINEKSSASDALLANGICCVNVLHDEQTYISDVFAGRYNDRFSDKFDCADWENGRTGAPRLVDPLVSFDCRISSIQKIGSHHVIVAEVEQVFTPAERSPLIYHGRAYRSSTAIDPVSWLEGTVDPGSECLSVGCFHTFSPFVLPRLIRTLVEARGPFGLNLVEGNIHQISQALNSGEAELALLYDFGLGGQLESTRLGQLQPYVLVSDGHPLAQYAEITPEMLADYPMISASEDASHDQLASVLESAGVEPKVSFRSPSLELVRGMVGQGLGYAIVLTKPAGSTTYDGRQLAARRLASDPPKASVVLAWQKGRALSPIAQNFALCCERTFRQAPLGEPVPQAGPGWKAYIED